MPLENGAKLGRYEIRSQLGEGGRGEVCLAKDQTFRLAWSNDGNQLAVSHGTVTNRVVLNKDLGDDVERGLCKK